MLYGIQNLLFDRFFLRLCRTSRQSLSITVHLFFNWEAYLRSFYMQKKNINGRITSFSKYYLQTTTTNGFQWSKTADTCFINLRMAAKNDVTLLNVFLPVTLTQLKFGNKIRQIFTLSSQTPIFPSFSV